MPGAARPRCSAEVPVSGAHRIAAVRLPLALTDRQPHGTCGLSAEKPCNPCTEARGAESYQTRRRSDPAVPRSRRPAAAATRSRSGRIDLLDRPLVRPFATPSLSPEGVFAYAAPAAHGRRASRGAPSGPRRGGAATAGTAIRRIPAGCRHGDRARGGGGPDRGRPVRLERPAPALGREGGE